MLKFAFHAPGAHTRAEADENSESDPVVSIHQSFILFYALAVLLLAAHLQLVPRPVHAARVSGVDRLRLWVKGVG